MTAEGSVVAGLGVGVERGAGDAQGGASTVKHTQWWAQS